MTSLERGSTAFTCPNCSTSLLPGTGALECPDCTEEVPVVDEIPRFVDASDAPTASFFDHLSSIYETPLWFAVMYRALLFPRLPPDDRLLVSTYLAEGHFRERTSPSGETGLEEHAVLDVARGTGRFTRYIAASADHVWGVDISPRMLGQARKYASRDGVENVTFALMDANELQFESEFFDGVACCWALHLFPNVEHVLEEVHRILSPGGRFAGTTLADASLLATAPVQLSIRQTLGARVFEQEQFRTLLQGAGFQEVTLERRGGGLFFGAVV